MARDFADLVGQKLERYFLKRLLHRSDTRAVFYGKNIETDEVVAVKVLLPKVFGGRRAMKERFRFEREAIMTDKLRHPLIVPVSDFFDYGDGDLACIVMPFYANGTLSDLIASEGRISLTDTVRYIERVAPALDHAHSHKIIHHDIKPSNFLLDHNNNLILADFGIARVTGNPNWPTLTSANKVLGTPGYMAPEVEAGERNDARSDIYALGIVVYEMLHGRDTSIAPYPLPALHTQFAEIPPLVDDVLRIATAKRPERRFKSASELAASLSAAAVLPIDYNPSTKIDLPVRPGNNPGRSVKPPAGSRGYREPEQDEPVVPGSAWVSGPGRSVKPPARSRGYREPEPEEPVVPGNNSGRSVKPPAGSRGYREPEQDEPVLPGSAWASGPGRSVKPPAGFRGYQEQEQDDPVVPGSAWASGPGRSVKPPAGFRGYQEPELDEPVVPGSALVWGPGRLNRPPSGSRNFQEPELDELFAPAPDPVPGQKRPGQSQAFSQPGQPKVRISLWLLGGLFLLFLIGGFVFALSRLSSQSGSTLTFSPGTPIATTISQQARASVQAYYDYWNKGEYEAAYHLLSPDYQKGYPYTQAHTEYKRVHGSCPVFGTVTPLADGTVKVDLTVTLIEDSSSGVVNNVYTLSFIAEKIQGEWRLMPRDIKRTAEPGSCQAVR